MINGKNIKNIFEKTNENKDIYFKNKNIYSKPKERIYQYPQVINNYDVNVKVNIKKLNDNNINIENMNIEEIIGKKLGINKRNKSTLKEQKEYFNRTDNNIQFLDIPHNKINTKKDGLYNNMITDLKNEFREIKKKHEINKEKNMENIRNFFFNENNENKINLIKEPYNNNRKRYAWNYKSVNNSGKKNKNKNIIKQSITQDVVKEHNKLNSNDYKIINDSKNKNYNKNKTQSNFYKIPDEYINCDNEATKFKEQFKNDEKILMENKQNLNKAIIYMNNKKTNNSKKKVLNLTNDFISNNYINNENNFVNLNEENKDMNLTLKNNNDIKKKNTMDIMIKNNNLMKNYVSSSNNQKVVIGKCNSYISHKNISIFNNTQKFINNDNEINKINKKSTKVYISNNNNNEENNNKRPQSLYLDKRINKIKNKMVNDEYINDLKTEIKNDMNIYKNISFSFIKKDNINKENETNKFNLNIINKIFKVQNNIILELKKKQIILKNELIKKIQEIKNYKNVCLKLMWFIKDSFSKSNINKKYQTIQNQIIKENIILRKLFINNKVNNIFLNNSKNLKIINDFNEQKIFNNALKKQNEQNKTENSNECGRMNTFENNSNDKKRNKSFERIYNMNHLLRKENKPNQNTNNIAKYNESNFKYINFREKKNKYIGGNNDINNIKSGKKIKYLMKDKNNLSLTFENININSFNI